MGLDILKLFNNTISTFGRTFDEYYVGFASNSFKNTNKRKEKKRKKGEELSTSHTEIQPQSPIQTPDRLSPPILFHDLSLQPLPTYDLSQIPLKSGFLLLAHPEYWEGDDWHQTVILITHHDDKFGTLGIILNKFKLR